MKKCYICKKSKASSEFPLRRGGPNRYGACRPCRRQRFEALKLHRRYGLTLEDIEERKRQQDYRCGICRRVRRLQVDHDHSTGEFRGLLCARCNQGLGYFKDNPKLLRAAVAYLTQA